MKLEDLFEDRGGVSTPEFVLSGGARLSFPSSLQDVATFVREQATAWSGTEDMRVDMCAP